MGEINIVVKNVVELQYVNTAKEEHIVKNVVVEQSANMDMKNILVKNAKVLVYVNIIE
jgi:hypothetical protein